MEQTVRHIHYSTKRFGPISVCHRQWKDKGHCRWVHGYGRIVKVVFACDYTDDRNWVVDFGDLRWFKTWLEDSWDHKFVVTSDDPLLDEFKKLEQQDGISLNIVDAKYAAMEGQCRYIFDYLNPMIKSKTDQRCWVHSVEIFEHENNSAIYMTPSASDYANNSNR